MVPEIDLRRPAGHPLSSDLPPPRTAPTTVRPGAKALVASDGEVLLVRERREDGSTFWSLPGGGVKPGESYRAALRRELTEELRCRPAIDPVPVAACVYRHTSLDGTVTLYSVYTADIAGDPVPNAREGILEYAWRNPAEPPDGILAPFRRLLLDLADL